MFAYNRKNYSYLLSVALHLVLILIFFAVNFSIEYDEDEYVTVGFGTFGKVSSTGAVGAENKKDKTPQKTAG